MADTTDYEALAVGHAATAAGFLVRTAEASGGDGIPPEDMAVTQRQAQVHATLAQAYAVLARQ